MTPKVKKKVTIQVNPRVRWDRKIDFLLSCVGLAVGLGNVWRFPYLCYKNGGGAFLIPYFVFLVGAGIPLFFLEVALGQYTSKGAISSWDICPLFKGIGYATTVVVFLGTIYYTVIMAWAALYFILSFSSELLWASCDNDWNTLWCNGRNLSFLNATNVFYRDQNDTFHGILNRTKIDPAVEFWQNKVLQMSTGIEDIGEIKWDLALCLAVVWLISYFCIWKGIKVSGKIVYFTAVFPYFILTALLIRGVTLPGAQEGLKFYLTPDFSKLLNFQVWSDAGTQIFFSYAIALGCLITLGSYNHIHNNCYRDTFIICFINGATSFYAGFGVFSILGFMAYQQEVPVANVVESGPGLIFITYPKAMTEMSIGPFWSVLFFLMVLLLGLDTQFAGIECMLSSAQDLFPGKFAKKHMREKFAAILVFISFLLGLPMMTRGGVYILQLFDYFAVSNMTILWIAFFECITVAWIYGGSRFYEDVRSMIGYSINPWMQICWTVITPLLILVIFLGVLIEYKPLKFNGHLECPIWALCIGWGLALSSMLCIPGYMIYKICATNGTLKQRLRILIIPFQKFKTLKNKPECAETAFIEMSPPSINCH